MPGWSWWIRKIVSVHEEYWGEFDADRISMSRASSSKMSSAECADAVLDDDGVL